MNEAQVHSAPGECEKRAKDSFESTNTFLSTKCNTKSYFC